MSREVKNLANPAFGAALLTEAVHGYCSENEMGMDLPLVYLVLPLVLPGCIRDRLPTTSATRLHAWLQANPEVKIQFPGQARSMVPQTKEGLRFALQAQTCKIDGEYLHPGAAKISVRKWDPTQESKVCLQRAKLVGKLLAKAGNTTTTFSMLGVRP